MKLSFKRGEKGFTLVELMVVMGIIAILASIVVPSVTGTKQVSIDSQVRQDASAMETAVSNYNADANLAQEITDVTLASGSVVIDAAALQQTSNKWPERAISDAYDREFPPANSSSNCTGVAILDKNGGALYSTNATNLDTFLIGHTAVNFTTLHNGGYIQEIPDSVVSSFSTANPYHNYLWLMEKVRVGDEATAGRSLQVFSLQAVQSGVLTYKQVF